MIRAAHLGTGGPTHFNCKRYQVTTPDGEVLELRGLAEFCRERGLSRGNMCETANGARSQHKGYKVVRIEAEIA